MSTRFYPRFVKGNPQLRVFLPDWKLIMMKPDDRMPNNIIKFRTDVRMTDWDIKNYLEKIYQVKVAAIKSRVMSGALHKSSKGLAKKEDYRIADVTLPPGQTFNWPELFPEEKVTKEREDYEKTLKEFNKDRVVDPNRRGIPTWFA